MLRVLFLRGFMVPEREHHVVNIYVSGRGACPCLCKFRRLADPPCSRNTYFTG